MGMSTPQRVKNGDLSTRTSCWDLRRSQAVLCLETGTNRRPLRIGFLHFLHYLHCFLIVQGGWLGVKTHLLRCGGVNLSVCYSAFSRLQMMFSSGKPEPFPYHLHDLQDLQCFFIVHTVRFFANPINNCTFLVNWCNCAHYSTNVLFTQKKRKGGAESSDQLPTVIASLFCEAISPSDITPSRKMALNGIMV